MESALPKDDVNENPPDETQVACSLAYHKQYKIEAIIIPIAPGSNRGISTA